MGTVPFYLVIVDDELFLQDFDRVQRIGFLFLREHDLAEVSLSKNS